MGSGAVGAEGHHADPTPTTVDQITAEKMKLSERLARLDADREKIATQLADLETAERVLTRVSKAPPGRRDQDRLRLQKQRPQIAMPCSNAAGLYHPQHRTVQVWLISLCRVGVLAGPRACHRASIGRAIRITVLLPGDDGPHEPARSPRAQQQATTQYPR
jgi:hypothetical protein